MDSLLAVPSSSLSRSSLSPLSRSEVVLTLFMLKEHEQNTDCRRALVGCLICEVALPRVQGEGKRSRGVSHVDRSSETCSLVMAH